MKYPDIFTDFRSLSNHDAHAMIYKTGGMNLGSRMNLYSRQESVYLTDDSGQQKQAVIPQPVSRIMHGQAVQARITE